MRGRKEQPAAIRAAKGNPGKGGGKATASRAPAPALKTAAPPTLTPAGKVIWRDLAAKLKSINLLRDTDLQSLALLRYAGRILEGDACASAKELHLRGGDDRGQQDAQDQSDVRGSGSQTHTAKHQGSLHHGLRSSYPCDITG